MENEVTCVSSIGCLEGGPSKTRKNCLEDLNFSRKMGITRQVLCAGIACFITMNLGLTFAWPSSTLRLFSSNETVLHRPMTEMEISLFGSLTAIGALISVPLMGFLLDRLGRKHCAIVSISTYVVCWSMIAVSSQVEVIITAIFISGIGGGAALVIPVFISEICQENIRGAMTSGPMIFYSIGMLISYVLGGTLPYEKMVFVCLTLAVTGLILLTLVRETPMYLMKKGLEEEAAKAFAFYRSAKTGSKEVMNEMDKLRRAFNAQLHEGDTDGTNKCEEEQNLNSEEKPVAIELKPPAEKLSVWKFVRKSRSTRRAMFVTLTLITAAIFQGLVVLQVNAQPLFEEAVPNVSPIILLVIFSLVSIISGFIAAYLTDVSGRRNLMIYSSILAGLCCVILGSQLHLHWAPHWVTALFIYMFTASYTFGAGTVPFVFLAEVFLPEVKSFITMLVFEWAWLCNFIILFIFNPVVAAIGLGPTFYLFATICILTAVFAAIYLPETKGLPVDAIQSLFIRQRTH